MPISIIDKCIYPDKPDYLNALDAGLTFTRVGFDYNTHVFTIDKNAKVTHETIKKTDSTCIRVIFTVLAVALFPVTLLCLALKALFWKNPEDTLEKKTQDVAKVRIEPSKNEEISLPNPAERKTPNAQVKDFYESVCGDKNIRILRAEFLKMVKGPDSKAVEKILFDDWNRMQPENPIDSIDTLVKTLSVNPRYHTFAPVCKLILDEEKSLYD